MTAMNMLGLNPTEWEVGKFKVILGILVFQIFIINSISNCSISLEKNIKSNHFNNKCRVKTLKF